MNLKYSISVACLLVISLLPALIHSQGKANWIVKNPFEQNVFIENKGQFTEEEKLSVGEPILFYTRKGKIHLYFTKHSIVFRYDSIYKEQDKEEEQTVPNKRQEEDDKNIKVKHLYLKMHWERADSNSFTETQNPVSNYYTYNNPGTVYKQLGIVANAWKKLTYHNLYNGIDVEFSYPEKGGIEYTIHVHPRADISKLKMTYSGNAAIQLMDGNAKILTSFSSILNLAPSAKDEVGNSVKIVFNVKDNTMSYDIGSYDRKQALTIANRQFSPSFRSYDKAFDLDCDNTFDSYYNPIRRSNKVYDMHYDNGGNIYVYGGTPPYQLQKYDSMGTLLWTYTNNLFRATSTESWCGDFTVDARSGSSYIVNGLNGFSITNIAVKVNTSGVPVDTLYNSVGIEMWKVSFDYCDNILVVGAGDELQACTIDTNLLAYTASNVLGVSTYCRDMCMIALDQSGNAYMATDSASFYTNVYANTLLRVSLPALSPTIYKVSDGHHFHELLSLQYYPPMNNGGFNYANGFNGMAADLNMVVTYDGSVVKRWIPVTGILQNSKTITNVPLKWGGLDIDCGDNIYMGGNDSIQIYDSSLVYLSSIPLPDSVYDVRVGNNRIYACGNGFVSSYHDTIFTPAPISVSITKSNFCSHCSATATAIISGCGSNSASVGYLWSNGQTTQTISGLCPGNYSVTVTLGCLSKHTDSVVITPDTNTSFQVTVSPVSDSLCWGSSDTLSANGANTYFWSPSLGLSCMNCPNPIASPTATTTYTVTGFDTAGCSDTATLTIKVFPQPIPIISPSPDSICNGSSVLLSIAGLSSYSWTPAVGLSCTSCPNPTATPTATATYTVTGANSYGCEGSDSITIKVLPLPVLIAIPLKDSICKGNPLLLSVSGASHYMWSPSASLSCDTCSNPTASPNVSTTYTIIGTNANGCKDSTSITITIIQTPVATITSPRTICPGDSVTLTASGGGTYHWSTGSIDSSIIVYPVSSTTYSVIITKECNVSASTTVTVIVPRLFACCDTTISTGTNVLLYANSAAKYKWMPLTGLNCDTCATVIASPAITTTYTVTGTDSAGCQTERIITVVVEIHCEDFIVPNVFTPNNSGYLGMNNVFYIKTTNLNSWSIFIYDRWGREMYKSTDPSTYWNGKTETGSDAPDGVYYYIINATCQNNTYTKEGFVQVIR